MAYNGVVLARAREHLAELRENNAAEAARRTGEHIKNARDFLFQTINSEEGTKDE